MPIIEARPAFSRVLGTILLATSSFAGAGCGEDGSAARGVSAESLAGSYDATIEAADGRRLTALGWVRAGAEGVEVHTSVDEMDASQSLRGMLRPDGTFLVDGFEQATDLGTGVQGTLTARADEDRIVIRGSVRDGGLLFFRHFDEEAAGPLELILVRPAGGLPRVMQGTHTVRMQLLPSPSGARTPSSLRLALDVARDGSCVSASAVESGGEARSRFEPGSCRVSPQGRFRLGAQFEAIPPNERILHDPASIGFQGRLQASARGLAGQGYYALPVSITPTREGRWVIEP